MEYVTQDYKQNWHKIPQAFSWDIVRPLRIKLRGIDGINPADYVEYCKTHTPALVAAEELCLFVVAELYHGSMYLKFE